MNRLAVLVALTKVFAPRPKVFVLAQMTGWFYAMDTHPRTGQPLIAVSWDVWCALVNRVRREQGVYLAHQVELSYITGHQHTSVRAPLMELTEIPQYLELVLQSVPPEDSHER
jgi:hypothetical protein